jgi:hypothetical protein
MGDLLSFILFKVYINITQTFYNNLPGEGLFMSVQYLCRIGNRLGLCPRESHPKDRCLVKMVVECLSRAGNSCTLRLPCIHECFRRLNQSTWLLRHYDHYIWPSQLDIGLSHLYLLVPCSAGTRREWWLSAIYRSIRQSRLIWGSVHFHSDCTDQKLFCLRGWKLPRFRNEKWETFIAGYIGIPV